MNIDILLDLCYNENIMPGPNTVSFTYYPWKHIQSSLNNPLRLTRDIAGYIEGVDENGYHIITGAHTSHEDLLYIHAGQSAPLVPVSIDELNPESTAAIEGWFAVGREEPQSFGYTKVPEGNSDRKVKEAVRNLNRSMAALVLTMTFLALNPPSESDPTHGNLPLPDDITTIDPSYFSYEYYSSFEGFLTIAAQLDLPSEVVSRLLNREA